MTSIKDYFVRVTKNGKKRGRPSKFEHYMSKTTSDIFKSEEFQKEMKECINDTLMYGTGIFDTRKAMTCTEAKMKSAIKKGGVNEKEEGTGYMDVR